MQRFAIGLTLAVLAAVLLTPGRSAGQPPVTPNLPEVKWELDRLNQEPFKLIKATPDAHGAQVRFVIEFTRPPRPTEQLDWERHNGAVVFRFLDEDGIVIRSVQPSWEGEFVPKKGARMALVLPMPNEKTLMRTYKVVAE
jgi:hypothetical protein